MAQSLNRSMVENLDGTIGFVYSFHGDLLQFLIGSIEPAVKIQAVL